MATADEDNGANNVKISLYATLYSLSFTYPR